MMNTTLDLLGKQHEEVLARLDVVENGSSACGASGDLTEFAAYLEGDVARHFGIEEQALFPVLARYPNLARGPLAVMDAEHAAFRERMHHLRAALQAGDVEQQRRCAVALIELLREHIAKEDNVLFPMAARLLSLDEQREVDACAAGL